MASAVSSILLRPTLVLALAASLCACGVHKPVQTHLHAAASDAGAAGEVELAGAPEGAPQAGERNGGFELAGGPAPRPAKAPRPAETSGGFELVAASDPAVARQAAATSASAVAAASSESAPEVKTTAATEVEDPASPLLQRVSGPGGPSARSAPYKAFALFPLGAPEPAEDAGESPKASPAPGAVGLGQVLMFSILLASAAGFWTFHGRVRAEALAARRRGEDLAT